MFNIEIVIKASLSHEVHMALPNPLKIKERLSANPGWCTSESAASCFYHNKMKPKLCESLRDIVFDL